MNGPIRPHQLSAGSALDRRHLEENFLFFAQRINSLDEMALGDATLRRSDVDSSAWMELFPPHAEGLNHATDKHAYLVSDTLRTLECHDGNFEATYTWTLDIEPIEGKQIWAYPVIDGQPVWGGADYASVGSVIVLTDLNMGAGGTAVIPADEERAPWNFETDLHISLGNRCTVVGGNGKAPIGVMVYSIGSFKIKAATASLKMVPR